MKQTNIRNMINVIICYGKDIFIYRSTPKKYVVIQIVKAYKSSHATAVVSGLRLLGNARIKKEIYIQRNLL